MLPKPKKSLGQNFLRDENVRSKIVSACAFGPDDTVLEIGAGKGEMTLKVAGLAKQVFAIEIDRRLVPFLKEKTQGCANVTVINKDILEFPLDEIPGKMFKVFGNIPYYITTPIIERLLCARGRIKEIYLTVQKEFGRRICASPGSRDYGSFSCFVGFYARPEILFLIKKNSFFPAPKVDSCLIRLSVRSEPACKVESEEYLFKVIRRAFQQRRKTLKNSLSGLVAEDRIESLFTRFGLAPGTRPERLSLEHFAFLSDPASMCVLAQ